MFRSKFLIQINYKSGISMQFWSYKFSIKGGDYEWEPVEVHRPINMNIDEIESVWQIRHKRFGFI